MTRGIAALIFDKDGTLFDFHATWSGWSRGFIEAEAAGDPVLMARIAAVLGFDLETGRFARDSIVIAETAQRIADRLLDVLPVRDGTGDREALVIRMNARAASAPQVEAAPLGPLLSGLKLRGLRLGLATNDAEAPARAHLAAAGVEATFDFIAGADSGHGAKPAPGQLLACAATLGLQPAACAMVGDSLHDLRAARAAGMTAIAVLTGIARRDDLSEAADLVLGSIAELPDWLDASAAAQITTA